MSVARALCVTLLLAACGPTTFGGSSGKSEAPSKIARETPRPQLFAPVKPSPEPALTPAPAASAPPERADCDRAVDKVLGLLSPAQPARKDTAAPDPDAHARVMEECLRSSRGEVACVNAAEATQTAVLACFQWDELTAAAKP